MNLGEILREGFRLIQINIVPILLLVICTQIPLNLIRTLIPNIVTVEEYGKTTVSAITLAISWVDYFIALIVFTGIAYIVERSLQGQSVFLGNVFQFSLSRFGDVFQTSLFLFIIILAFTLLLIIPGIIWSNYTRRVTI